MSCLSDPRIERLQRSADAETGELNLAIGEECFRINLRDDNIKLWQETLEQQNATANLLLACENNGGELAETRLTWVVGSAIRSTQVPTSADAAALLQSMGVSAALGNAAVEHCPGLGDDLIWAFYLERHGWLIATPVAALKR
ncbi:MAG: hypothetical protein ACPHAS_06955 [Synechococcus sp.]